MSLELLIVMVPGVLVAALVCIAVKPSDEESAPKPRAYPASLRRK